MARLGLRWGKVAWVALAASCAFGAVGCSDEDEPDNGQPDATSDAKSDTKNDVSVGTDARTDTSVDQRDGGAPDASPDATPDGGACVGGGDAARDGAIGMAAVQMLRCANCHQDEPVDAGLILSGKLNVGDSGVYPKNITPDPATGIGCWTDQQIISAIMDGIDDEGRTLCSRMPKFNTRIDAGVAQEIVNFLRTIQAVHKEIPDTVVCPPPPEPQPDGGADADAGAPPEGGPDGGPDAGPDGVAPDGGTDGTSPPDATPDTGSTDSGSDAGTQDGGTDVVIDTGSDAGTTDVEIDGGG